jgi:hypothetical protein
MGLTMRVLVACEFSGRVRDAFIARGHDAMSCDYLPTDLNGPHYQGDVRSVINDGWDLMIAHPPCTYLCGSGARWWYRERVQQEQVQAINFCQYLLDCNIPKIALENPVGILSSKIRPPDQIVQPWQFGHGETKATCLWLIGLPLLKPTEIVQGRSQNVFRCPPGKERWKIRSLTYLGIAGAMAEQWG